MLIDTENMVTLGEVDIIQGKIDTPAARIATQNINSADELWLLARLAVSWGKDTCQDG